MLEIGLDINHGSVAFRVDQDSNSLKTIIDALLKFITPDNKLLRPKDSVVERVRVILSSIQFVKEDLKLNSDLPVEIQFSTEDIYYIRLAMERLSGQRMTVDYQIKEGNAIIKTGKVLHGSSDDIVLQIVREDNLIPTMKANESFGSQRQFKSSAGKPVQIVFPVELGSC